MGSFFHNHGIRMGPGIPLAATTELFKILEGKTPNYLSELFVKADTPYDTRDKFKLIQPLKRTTTYGLRSFQYYGAHVWNMLPVNMKAAQSLHEFKSSLFSV